MTPPDSDMIELRTSRLRLRPLAPRDAEGFMAFLCSDRARFIGGPMDRAGAWQVLAMVLGHWQLRGFGLFAVCPQDDNGTGDDAVATVGCLWPEGWPEGEIAWHIWTPEAEGRGIAMEAAQAALRFAHDRLGWKTAVSYIHRDNARAISLARRMGAVHDPDAAVPARLGAQLVYRHPAPEGARHD